MRYKALHRAKLTKNDEFYTTYQSVKDGISLIKDQLKFKTIYCNCDSYKESNFVKYFRDNFKDLQLKSITATHYSNTQHDIFLTEITKPCLYRKTATTRVVHELLGNGSYRSNESVTLLKQADIVITNPPFSKIRDYIDLLLKYKKDFLIIAPLDIITSFKVFDRIKAGKIKPIFELKPQFTTPDNPTTTSINSIWLTTLDYESPYELILNAKYHPDKYPTYAIFNAINVDKVKDIPVDYYGIMGVPMTYLKYHGKTDFETIDVLKASKGIRLGVKPYSQEHRELYKSQNLKNTLRGVDGDVYYLDKTGKVILTYERVAIRRKPPTID